MNFKNVKDDNYPDYCINSKVAYTYKKISAFSSIRSKVS